MKIAVSYLKSAYSKEETISKIMKTSADYIHVDLMDGKFVPNQNMDWMQLIPLLKNSKKPLDVHLMTNEIEIYLEKLKELNPEYVTFHIEAPCNIEESIQRILKEKIKVGLAINPNTPIEELFPYLNQLDQILVMGVTPGYGGQSFQTIVLEKLKKLKELQTQHHFIINVDGGINDQTINCVQKYVDMIVSGSYICEALDYEKQVKNLKQ